MSDEKQLREEVAALKKQLSTTQQTIVVKEKRSGAGGVFWGLFHFFITLPIVLLVSCGGCVALLGQK